jgi:murein DD-endopeptidase MepM/ murein hydrolase activator NlpD
LSLIFLLTPSLAEAFSLSDLFSTPANAAGISQSTLPDPALALLDAPTNSDPSAGSAADAPDTTEGTSLVAHAGPGGTIADIEDNPTNGQISIYVVRPGDSLSDIASMFDVSVNTIIWANNLKSAKDIHVGDTLVILPVSGLKYTVAKGDTLASVAKKYNADAGEIAQFNGLDAGSALSPGSTLIIPGGELEAPASGSAPSAASAPSSKPVPSTQILEGQHASGNVIPFSNNPAEPVRGIGPVGTPAQINYYTSPLAHFIQTQNIHGYNAVDLAAPKGTPIMAAAAGRVIVARSGGWNGGYGNYVVISHDNGSQTLYAHMSTVAAVVGEEVVQGQVIGRVGMTGDATGPHVHFEIRDGIRNPF